MELTKKTCISLLREMLTTQTRSREFAESKVSYLDPSISVRHSVEHNQFMEQRHRCEVKINQIESCITWLKTIENKLEKDKV